MMAAALFGQRQYIVVRVEDELPDIQIVRAAGKNFQKIRHRNRRSTKDTLLEYTEDPVPRGIGSWRRRENSGQIRRQQAA